MARPKKDEVEGTDEAYTQEEFFSLPDWKQRNANILVTIKGKSKLNEFTDEKEQITPDRDIMAAPDYWNSILRDEKGNPIEKQILKGYWIDKEKDENGDKVIHSFK